MVKASRMPDFSAMGTIESELFQEVLDTKVEKLVK